MRNFFKVHKNFILACLGLVVLLTPFLVSAAGTSIDNPIKNPAAAGVNVTVVDIVIGSFVGFGSVIALFALGWLIISGFRMIIARDNPEAITTAKNAVAWSVAGLGAAILSVTIILSVSALIGGTNDNELAHPNTLVIPFTGSALVPVPGANNGFLGVFVNIFTNLFKMTFVVCALMVLYAGYTLIFSAGNEERITAAKTILTWAIAGLAVVIFSYIIIAGVNRVLTNLPNNPTGL